MIIREVLGVEDTRDYIELDDRFFPVSGSGVKLNCQACGRVHEVHATVLLQDGTTAVVGTGCMMKQEFEDYDLKQLKSRVNAAKRLPKLKAEKQRILKQFDRNSELDEWGENTRINDVACDWRTPNQDFELTVEFLPKFFARKNVTKLSISGAFVIVDGDIRKDGLEMCKAVTDLTTEWFYQRKKERGWIDPLTLRHNLQQVEDKLKKAQLAVNS